MKKEGGKLSEMTPSELYEIFVDISRVKFHVILTYNYDDTAATRVLRTHKSVFSTATQINLKVQNTFSSFIPNRVPSISITFCYPKPGFFV